MSQNDFPRQEAQARIAALEKEVQSEQQQRQELEKELRGERQLRQQAQTRADVLEKKLESQRHQTHDLASKIHAERSKAAQASAILAAHKQISSDSRQERVKLQDRVDGLQDQKRRLEQQLKDQAIDALQNVNEPIRSRDSQRPELLGSPRRKDTHLKLEQQNSGHRRLDLHPGQEIGSRKTLVQNFRRQRESAVKEVEQDVQTLCPSSASQATCGSLDDVPSPTSPASLSTTPDSPATPIKNEQQHTSPDVEIMKEEDLARYLSEDIKWTSMLLQQRARCENDLQEIIEDIPSLENAITKLEEESRSLQQEIERGTPSQKAQKRWDELDQKMKGLRSEFALVKGMLKKLRGCKLDLEEETKSLNQLQESLRGPTSNAQTSENGGPIAIQRKRDEIYRRLKRMEEFFIDLEQGAHEMWQDTSKAVHDLSGSLPI
ncbi:MAG: hypothetical protein Q9225_005611 [Loekoesia sp. 1 TL-2023]